ncbi:MAG: hypothetical protein ABSB96_11960 [Gaiellaceae bacterium]
MRRRARLRGLIVLGIIAIIAATAAYAYTSSINNVNPPLLGSGSGVIGKYSVVNPGSNITYNLNANSPQNIDSMTFPLTGASTSTQVKIQLISGGTWYSCTVAAGAPPTVTCPTTAPQATAIGINGGTLTIVATG